MSNAPFIPLILPRPFQNPPQFAVPLSQDELQELGTFVVIWSQIDFLAAHLIAHLTNTNLPACILFLETSTTSPRMRILQKSAERPPASAAKKDIIKLCKDNGGLIESRNHLLHGFWGVNWDHKSNKVEASALYQKGITRPIAASKIKELSNRAANLSNGLGKAWRTLSDPDNVYLSPPMTFLFGDGDPPPHMPPPSWPPEQHTPPEKDRP